MSPWATRLTRWRFVTSRCGRVQEAEGRIFFSFLPTFFVFEESVAVLTVRFCCRCGTMAQGGAIDPVIEAQTRGRERKNVRSTNDNLSSAAFSTKATNAKK